jgi:hypothetical protein
LLVHFFSVKRYVENRLALRITCSPPAKNLIEAAKTTQANILLIEATITNTGGSDSVHDNHSVAWLSIIQKQRC